MVRIVKAQEKEKKKTGRKPKLIVEDQILIMLEYLREYRTLYHISLTWKMSESNVCRIVHKIENILIKSGQFRLRGKKRIMAKFFRRRDGSHGCYGKSNRKTKKTPKTVL